jgi:PEP-CTERM motif-containing protein
MRVVRLAWLPALGLILSLPTGGLANPLTYTFTQVTDSSGAFSRFVGGASINNEGTVAFLATLRAGGEAIVVGNGQSTMALYATGGSFSAFGFVAPAINDRADVAFVAGLPSGSSGVFTGNGGPVTIIGDTSGPFSSFINQRPPINNAGVVAFSAVLSAGGEGVFTGRGGSVTTIVDSSGPVSNFSFQSINQDGIVAFSAGLGDAIVTGSGGPVAVLYDTGGPFRIFRPPDINDTGTVAFFAQLDDSSIGIFTGNGGPVTTVATGSSSFRPFNDPALNDQGTVAFTAFLGGGMGMGIFTGPDPGGDRVIATGDPLFGSIVVGLDFTPTGLNDAGQIAFAATLADGRQVVARADLVVPEPSTLVLVAVGILSLVGYGRRR